MSEFTQEELACPQCGGAIQAQTWNSINVTQDPELKTRLLEGSLFRLQCPQCGHTADRLHELLYHDMQKRFLAWLVAPGPDGRPLADPSEMEDVVQMLQGYRLRLVTSINGLFEKVFIFDAGLDDRVVELLKTSLWLQNVCDTSLERGSVLFSHLESDEKDQPQRLVFVQLLPSGSTSGYTVTWEEGYLRSEAYMRSTLGLPLIEPPQWLAVDDQYIASLGQ